MSLWGYKKKSKPALWRTFGAGKAQSDAEAVKTPSRAKGRAKKPLPILFAWATRTFTATEFENLEKKYGDPRRNCPFPVKKAKADKYFGPLMAPKSVDLTPGAGIRVAKKRNRIATRSNRKRKADAAYNPRVQEWKIENPRCLFPGCTCKTEDNHHRRGRAGRLLMDERFWTPLCSRHHRWVHDNIAEARALGLICEKGKWGSLT